MKVRIEGREFTEEPLGILSTIEYMGLIAATEKVAGLETKEIPAALENARQDLTDGKLQDSETSLMVIALGAALQRLIASRYSVEGDISTEEMVKLSERTGTQAAEKMNELYALLASQQEEVVDL